MLHDGGIRAGPQEGTVHQIEIDGALPSATDARVIVGLHNAVSWHDARRNGPHLRRGAIEVCTEYKRFADVHKVPQDCFQVFVASLPI
jgi:hypothetical protein